MQSTINTSLSFIISLAVLSGWFVSDFRLNDATNATFILPDSIGVTENKIVMSPAFSTPNIDTNWFSSNTSGMSSQLPSAQARKDDDDSRIAQGRIMGESFGCDGDL